MKYAEFEGCSFRKADFVDTNLEVVTLFKCNFESADFNSAILDYATIAQCNFHDACMKNVSARKICGELAIENVPLYGMRLSGTKWHASSATYGEKQVTGYHQTKASIEKLI